MSSSPYIPSDEMQRLETERMVLEPITRKHTQEMMNVLNEESLHIYIPSDPLSFEKIEKRFLTWEKRVSDSLDEVWLNWAARDKKSNEVFGHFQAGVRQDGNSYIAYLISSKFQKQGLAKEALIKILSFLKEEMKLKNVKAWIDTRNNASIALVTSLGMKKIKEIKDADFFKGKTSHEFVFELKFTD